MKIRFIFFSSTIFFLILLSCENKARQTETTAQAAENVDYLGKGKEIALATFAAMSGKLQAAMQEGGVLNAVAYCNLAAFPLADSLSNVHNARIRRTSLKVRNAEDAPTPEERSVLEQYEKMARAGDELKPMVREIDDRTVVFYAPIKVNAFCLQCHGKEGETLKAEDYAVIRKLYPEDQAIGYVDGDLRGMWSIRFKK